MINKAFEKELAKRRIVAVLTIDAPEDAVPLARSLLEGGISAIELTLRTPAAIESISRVVQEVPDMSVGVGTVLRPDQCYEIARGGAAFALAPGLNPRVVEGCRAAGVPFIPGVATPSEVEQAVELGCRVLKLFPSESLGGVEYIKRLNGPYQFLGLKYLPLGGVNEANLEAYLSEPSVIAVGGSWIAKRDSIREERWKEITKNAERAVKIAEQKER